MAWNELDFKIGSGHYMQYLLTNYLFPCYRYRASKHVRKKKEQNVFAFLRYVVTKASLQITGKYVPHIKHCYQLNKIA